MQITVSAINWPQSGRKTGSVIDTTGKRWLVYADKVSGYQQGQTYEITHKTSVFNGTTYFYIETAMPVAGQMAAQQPTQRAAPAPAYSNPNPPNDNQRRMDIFVCGAFNNAMANPNWNPDQPSEHYIRLLIRLIAAWKATLGPQPDPISTSSAREEMNDDIPF